MAIYSFFKKEARDRIIIFLIIRGEPSEELTLHLPGARFRDNMILCKDFIFIYMIAVVSLARAEFCLHPSSRGCNQLFMQQLFIHQIHQIYSLQTVVCRLVSLYWIQQ